MNIINEIGDAFYQNIIYDNRYKFILEGLFHTVLIAFFAVILGIIIGIIISLVRVNYEQNKKGKFLSTICKWYVDIIRGTPVVLQLMIIYYVIFKSVDISTIIVGILAFGINSVPIGQTEAGYALGLKYGQVMRYIVLPQAIRNILPALGNEFITLLKETSVGAYVGIIELTKASDIIASRTYDYFFPLLIIAIIYLVMTLGLSNLVNKLERKLKNARN